MKLLIAGGRAGGKVAFDSVCHLEDPRLGRGPREVVETAREAGVKGMLLVGGDPSGEARVRSLAVELAQPFALGLHPAWVDDGWRHHLPALDGVMAVGEVGLDRRFPHQEAQEACFRWQLAQAAERSLPVVIHAVGTLERVLEIVGNMELRGFVHGFTKRSDLLPRLLDTPMLVSFGPDLARSPATQRSLMGVPLARLLLESDAPSRPIADGRGEPVDVLRVAEVAAGLRSRSVEEIREATTANALNLLGMPHGEAA